MGDSKTLRQIIQDAVFAALERHNWNKQEAAKELGISLKSIYNHISRMESEIIGKQQRSTLPMAQCTTCESDDRNECRCEQDCVDCGHTVSLDQDCEWPETSVRCWSCLEERLQEANAVLKMVLQHGRVDDSELRMNTVAAMITKIEHAE